LFVPISFLSALQAPFTDSSENGINIVSSSVTLSSSTIFCSTFQLPFYKLSSLKS
jgi:hypothetical protein